MQLADKKILVIGAARSGIAAANQLDNRIARRAVENSSAQSGVSARDSDNQRGRTCLQLGEVADLRGDRYQRQNYHGDATRLATQDGVCKSRRRREYRRALE